MGSSPVVTQSLEQQTNGQARFTQGQGGKLKKPLSAGFKAIIWTTPPPVGYYDSTTATAATRAASTSRRGELPTERLAPCPIYTGASGEPQYRFSSWGGGEGVGGGGFRQTIRPDVGPVVSAAGKKDRQTRICSDPNPQVRRLPRTMTAEVQQQPLDSPQQREQQQQQQVVVGAPSVLRTTVEVQVVTSRRRTEPTQRRLPISKKAEDVRQSYIPASRSEEFGRRGDIYERAAASGNPAVEDTAGQPAMMAGRALSFLPEGVESSTSNSNPTPVTRPMVPELVDECGNVVGMERSLSDSSVMTATSDFSSAMPTSNTPVILTAMSDEDAIAALLSLLAKGKGLPVVKHATGLGSIKSRKLLKFHKAGMYLSLSGVLPPYFKTKIPVQDIDRVDAKWCCVVVHAKGRSPIRLEVDSAATADTLRVGFLAASRVEPTPSQTTRSNKTARVPPLPLPPPPSGDAPQTPQEGEQQSDRRRKEKDPEQGLASVRPGHRLSEIYDPDAALSVAALLAKELEEERLMCSAERHESKWASARSSSRTPELTPPINGAPADDKGSPPPPPPPPAPTLKRSASMSSVVSSRMGDTPDAVDPITNRLSLPRGYGGPMFGPGASKRDDLVVVDAKASLRRLYDAIEGSGMPAVKRNANGKGGSRVMVRSKIKEKSIGWAHVLPPFSRKFVAVSALDGANRVSRVVTVIFNNREPAIFETDKLTDAQILEQGFVALATIHKHEGFGS